MSLTSKEIEHIAHLARLQLSEEEKARYREQLSSILEHVAKLQTLDTGDIEPMSSVVAERSRLREDEAGESLSSKELLDNAPDTHSNQFRVPPVLDHEST